jgi:hypothetical protein
MLAIRLNPELQLEFSESESTMAMFKLLLPPRLQAP